MLDVRTRDVRNFNKNLVKTFSVVNPTAGTGIAEALKAAFAATAAGVLMRNTAQGYVRPKRLDLVYTVAPVNATAGHLRVALDKGATRWASGGSSLTPTNRDMSSGVASNVTFRAGALVTGAASSNVRYIAQRQFSSVIPVVGDNVVILFGDHDRGAAGMGTIAGTTARQIVIDVGPVTLGFNQELIIHDWYPANDTTPASWEITAHWEETSR